MKKFLLIMLSALMLPIFSVNASGKKDDKKSVGKKELREERRKEQHRKDSVSYVMAVRAVKSDSWVFSATSVTATGGPNVVVQPNVNFIKVDGKEMTFQTSTGFGGGPNNLGGITVRANVRDKVVSSDKHGDTTCSFRFSGTAINGKISITIPRNSSYAYAYINFDNGRALSMNGQVVPMAKAKMSVGSYVN
ncbi:MAG: DUF4251 domain-containing protein [Bacteroidetes bacterium]|uniref:DUF4251 domain-containing protein n=1 Tax=Candidatus Caccoplasma merdipullorum TaxID=2840718 RepID=A0A9D9E2V2_9BACT|nr:DUF4251 domain-containing protein [Candidatus Caccoplasma merdipullorum]